jgi:hypothetical protein
MHRSLHRMTNQFHVPAALVLRNVSESVVESARLRGNTILVPEAEKASGLHQLAVIHQAAAGVLKCHQKIR